MTSSDQVSVRFDEETLATLDVVAEQLGVSRSEVVRRAIRAYGDRRLIQ